MHFRTTALLAATFAVAGCTSSPSLLECAQDLDCGEGAVCASGSCAANAPPSADFVAPAGASTNKLITIESVASDPEGRPVGARWTVRAMADGCAPDVEPQKERALTLILWCPGTYEVTLVPVDDQGLEGAPVVRSFEVAEAVGAPRVTAGPAIVAAHRCDPSSCRVEGPGGSPTLQLGAVAYDPEGEPLTYRWSAFLPPFAADDPTLQATVAYGAADAAPTAAISNGSGGAIAGTYRFRVWAIDPGGLIGQAFQEVVVGNGTPTAASASWLLPHSWAGGLYVAEGEVPSGALDPDGDALSVEGTLAPDAPASCTEAVTPSPTPGALKVRIACALPSELIGAAPRTLLMTVTDPNGGVLTLVSPLAIENRPPEIALDPGHAPGGVHTVDHRVEPCQLASATSCFVATGTDPFIVADPDGDPLGETSLAVVVDLPGTSSRATVTFDGGTRGFRYETPVGLPLEFRTAAEGHGLTLVGTAQDPWGATGRLESPVGILNRAPIVKEDVSSATVPHTYDAATGRYLATARGALFEDPDGDPLDAAARPAGSCADATLESGRANIRCEREWRLSGTVPPLESFLTAGNVLVTVSDGWERVSSTTNVTILDRASTIALPTTPIDNCVCADVGLTTRRWIPGLQGVEVPVELTDADGDPSLVSLDVSLHEAPPPVSCLPGSCLPSMNCGTCSASRCFCTAVATADSGATGIHPATVATLTVTCSLSGQSCE